VRDDEARIELGRLLFFDPVLSGPKNISCGDCHSPVAGTGDDLPMGFGTGAIGLGEKRRGSVDILTPRNTPHIYNMGHADVRDMFWDARIAHDYENRAFFAPAPELTAYDDRFPERAYRPDIISTLDGVLAAQALFPLVTPPEMQGFPGQSELGDTIGDAGRTWDRIMRRLLGANGIAEYEQLFAAAFPDVHPSDFNIGHLGVAIAAFERSEFAATETPLDRYLRGELDAMSDAAKRGAGIFLGKGKCAQCHNGPLLSDFKFYALAVPQFGIGAFGLGDDVGKTAFPKLVGLPADDRDDYRFRTPTLRNIGLTAPYFHSGAFTELSDVIRHHNDPVDSLETYDISQVPALFHLAYEQVRDRNNARLSSVPPILRQGLRLTESEIQFLSIFLDEALTDPASLDQTHLIPATVPSGLPVNQPE
jgi:cytochrome c peroxidase